MSFPCYKVDIAEYSYFENMCLDEIYLAIAEGYYWIEYKDDTGEVFLFKKKIKENIDVLEYGEEVVTNMIHRFANNKSIVIKKLQNEIPINSLDESTLKTIQIERIPILK